MSNLPGNVAMEIVAPRGKLVLYKDPPNRHKYVVKDGRRIKNYKHCYTSRHPEIVRLFMEAHKND